jgi:hypothetical protein
LRAEFGRTSLTFCKSFNLLSKLNNIYFFPQHLPSFYDHIRKLILTIRSDSYFIFIFDFEISILIILISESAQLPKFIQLFTLPESSLSQSEIPVKSQFLFLTGNIPHSIRNAPVTILLQFIIRRSPFLT